MNINQHECYCSECKKPGQFDGYCNDCSYPCENRHNQNAGPVIYLVLMVLMFVCIVCF